MTALQLAFAFERRLRKAGLAGELGFPEGGGAEKLAGIEAGGRRENSAFENRVRRKPRLVEARGPCELGLREIGAADHDRRPEIRLAHEARPLEPHTVSKRAILLLEELRPLEVGGAVENRVVEYGLPGEFGCLESGVGLEISVAEIDRQLEFCAGERNRPVEHRAGKVERAGEDEPLEVDLLFEMLIREIGIGDFQPKLRFIVVALAVPIQAERACLLEIGFRFQNL